MVSFQNKDGQFVVLIDENVLVILVVVELLENLWEFIINFVGVDFYFIVIYIWMLFYFQYVDVEKVKGIEVMVEFGLNEG